VKLLDVGSQEYYQSDLEDGALVEGDMQVSFTRIIGLFYVFTRSFLFSGGWGARGW
jgi:hypothetical protein